MNFDLPEEKAELREHLRGFLAREVSPDDVRRWDRTDTFPRDVWRRLGDIGVLGIAYPEEYGGSGGGILDEVIVTEELGRTAAALAFGFVATASFGGYTISHFGTEEQRKMFLPAMASGDLITAMALTEPEGGTDILNALRSRAQVDGGDFVINGQKIFSTGSADGEWLITVVRTDPDPPKPSLGLSVVLVPTDAAGLEIRPIEKLGMHGIKSCLIFFDDVRVPVSNLLGERDRAWYQLVATLNNERILIAAYCAGVARAAIDYAVGYALERNAFGGPIGRFQAIQHPLADSQVELEVTRTMIYKAAWLLDHGLPCAREAAVAKLHASEAALRASLRGMQVMGGHSYMMEHDMQRYLRDCVVATTGPISNEMVRNQVAEGLGLPRSY